MNPPVCSHNGQNSGNKSRSEPSYAQMKTQPTNPKRNFLSKIALLAGIAFMALCPKAHAAPIIWNGPITTNYTEPSPGAADVIIPGKVSLARNSRQWLYNTNTETGPFEMLDGTTF